MTQDIYKQSVKYHKKHPRGKMAIIATKPLTNQRDLSLAYSPGVAEPCRMIAKDANEAAYMTSKANLVGVITNGTAVLGLGNIGPLAAKPVMEGKCVLFKKFAGLDAFDIEVNQPDTEKFIEVVAALEPTFGGINLEDIKAPECFHIEKELSERLNIPVFHDDQHGTAIITSAAIINGLKLVNKNIADVKLVASGAGAASIACLNLLLQMGIKRENIILCDSKGIVHNARTDKLDATKKEFSIKTELRTIEDAVKGADIFLGLSVAGIMTEEMVASLADNPIIFALSNPEPEVRPELVKKVRDDAIIATGRSDYPNQVNNVLCYPYIFRGALDVGATKVNNEMKLACVHAIAELAQAELTDFVTSAYSSEDLSFGKNYIIPKPFDRRLFVELTVAVAEAAMDSGVAQRPIEDIEAYRQSLNESVHQFGMVMRPIFSQAKALEGKLARIVFAEGEEERVLQAVQDIIDDKIAKPILIGRPEVIESRINRLSLRMKQGVDFELVNPHDDARYRQYWNAYHDLLSRKGVTPALAKTIMRTNTTVIAAMILKLKDADAVVCGAVGRYVDHVRHVYSIIGGHMKHTKCASLCGLDLDTMAIDSSSLFITDPFVNVNPAAEQLAEITLEAVKHVKSFGITPKVAMVSHSNFGMSRQESSKKMINALNIIRDLSPGLEIDGEMHANAALLPEIRDVVFPGSTLSGSANLLVMPNIDAANIAFNLARSITGNTGIEPILMGLNGVAHVVTSSVRSRGIYNIAAIAAAQFIAKETN